MKHFTITFCGIFFVITAIATPVLAGHSHSIDDVTELQTALDAKADQGELDALTATVIGKAAAGHSHGHGNTAVVATSGGEYTSPVDAVNDIASWCGTPGVNNPCLVQVMPGVYDIGTSGLILPEYVDLAGSGPNVTVLVGVKPLPDSTLNGMIQVSHSAIRDITVECVGNPSGMYVSAISSQGTYLGLKNVSVYAVAESGASRYLSAIYSRASETSIMDAKVEAVNNSSGGTRYGHAIDLYNVTDGSLSRLNIVSTSDNPSYTGTSRGVQVYSNLTTPNRVTIDDTRISATGGNAGNGIVYMSTGTDFHMDGVKVTEATVGFTGFLYDQTSIFIDRSELVGTLKALGFSNGSTGATAFVSNSKVDGPIDPQTATLKCVGVIDGNYDPVVCP